ncbi:MAG: 3-methyladenine DNA glycosylase [Verrucomicrobiota bacterium]|nr:3-methyladenine DNA glycosylase [Verrucomicrobiota bacterium]
MEILHEQVWLDRARAHSSRVSRWVQPHLQRKSMEQKEPVVDFLFSYYSLRPGQLLKWTPGEGVILGGARGESFLNEKHFARVEGRGVALDIKSLASKRMVGLSYIRNLLRTTLVRPAQFACYGLHEWAMVYRAPEIRHTELPLRMAPDQIARFVETQNICCTHFDAFRFFTPEARPRNKWQLERPGQTDFEQPGCIHANMDLYKWAYKLLPWIASELVADCFELAMTARKIDMRASPYDLEAAGYAPIRIETPEGREEYVEAQKQIARDAEPLRQRLIQAYERVIGHQG